MRSMAQITFRRTISSCTPSSCCLLPLKTRVRTNYVSGCLFSVKSDVRVTDQLVLTGILSILHSQTCIYPLAYEPWPVHPFTHPFMLSPTLFPQSHSTICPLTHSINQPTNHPFTHSHHQSNHLPPTHIFFNVITVTWIVALFVPRFLCCR
jgi:hypothetical protein